MEAIFLMFVLVIAVVIAVQISNNSNSSSSVIAAINSLSGSIVLVNTNPINPGTGGAAPLAPDFKTVSSITNSLFSYDTSLDQITVLKSANYIVTINMTPDDNIIVTTPIIVQPVLTIFSNTTNKPVLFINLQVAGIQIGATFSFISTNVVNLPAGSYSLTGAIVFDFPTGNNPLISAGKASFTISTAF